MRVKNRYNEYRVNNNSFFIRTIVLKIFKLLLQVRAFKKNYTSKYILLPPQINNNMN